MRVLVTGGTGFVGSHLVRALLAEGTAVRCLARPTSRTDNLAGLDVEIVRGDLCDAASLERAVTGCEQVYHCAADYRLYARRPAELYASNVDGTRNLLAAADKAGVAKVVYTSTVGALGLHPDGTPADETVPVTLEGMIGHYKRSKFLAEREADVWVERGLPVVIVNPSTPVGERDIKPTDTGRLIVDFLNRKIPAYVDTGLNLIDVRDVAAGHLLAAAKGRIGERYILGAWNLELREILELLSKLTGLPAPRRRLPHWLPIGFAAVDTTLARLFGHEPRVSYEAALLSRYKMFFSAEKAVRELGLPQTPVAEPLRRAVDWFREQGYVRG
jgi:dihydroflavonol-4-reductase